MNVESVLKLYSNPTGYEKGNGIKNSEWELFEDYGNVKFFINRKSDGSITFLVVFKSALGDNNWCGWMPNEKQCRVLINNFPSVAERINEYNLMIKNGW